jgi:hypothetical protein
MKHLGLRLFLLSLSLCFSPTLSGAMDLSIVPRGAGSNTVYLSGPIERGDAEKIWNGIRGLDYDVLGSELNIIIDSPWRGRD